MRKTFLRALATLGAMVMVGAGMLGVAVVAGEASILFGVAIGIIVFLTCLSPLVMLVSAIAGIGALVDWSQNRNRQEKRKREFYDDFGDDEDMNMDDIMSRLTPQQQAYLQDQLRQSRLGVGTDGEMMSMSDLLKTYKKEKRS